MNSFDRVLMTLQGQEPDRVPYFLLLSTYGAKEAQVEIKDYFYNPRLVASTQLAMQSKYGHDCLYAFYYASIEFEAFGGSTIFFSDGPPNAGKPIIKKKARYTKYTGAQNQRLF